MVATARRSARAILRTARRPLAFVKARLEVFAPETLCVRLGSFLDRPQDSARQGRLAPAHHPSDPRAAVQTARVSRVSGGKGHQAFHGRPVEAVHGVGGSLLLPESY